MSLAENISNYWQFFILAPVAFVSAKIFSLNSRVAVNENDIKTLKTTCENLCAETKESNRLLTELNTKFEIFFKK